MKKHTAAGNMRKPPDQPVRHAEIEDWVGRQMPALQPILKQLDQQIRRAIPEPRFAIKWQKAYYGASDLGWVIEMVAYDVSVNLVFLGGSHFDDPPPDGTGDSRYVKLKSLDDAKAPSVGEWIEEAARTRGWK